MGLEDAPVFGDGHKRPHVVETVGQLDDDDADVLGHGEEHLAQVERLLLRKRAHGDVRKLGDAVHELGDLLAKKSLDLLEGGVGVLHGVVKQPRAECVRVGVQVLGQDYGDLDGVVDVGLAALALLAPVVAQRKAVGLLDPLHILGGQIGTGGLLKDGEVVLSFLKRSLG